MEKPVALPLLPLMRTKRPSPVTTARYLPNDLAKMNREIVLTETMEEFFDLHSLRSTSSLAKLYRQRIRTLQPKCGKSETSSGGAGVENEPVVEAENTKCYKSGRAYTSPQKEKLRQNDLSNAERVPFMVVDVNTKHPNSTTNVATTKKKKKKKTKAGIAAGSNSF